MFTNHVEADFVVGAPTVEDGNAVPAAYLLGHGHLSVCNSQPSSSLQQYTDTGYRLRHR